MYTNKDVEELSCGFEVYKLPEEILSSHLGAVEVFVNEFVHCASF